MSPSKVVVQARPLWRSRTVWLGVAVAALGVLEYAQTLNDVPSWALIIIGAAVGALRKITVRPVTMSVRPRSVQVEQNIADPDGG